MSESNLHRLPHYALLDEAHITAISVPKAAGDHASGSFGKSIMSSIAQQEKEFLKAVQPGLPISVLLSSARQPLLMATNGTPESPLIRKLQAAVRELPVTARGLRELQD